MISTILLAVAAVILILNVIIGACRGVLRAGIRAVLLLIDLPIALLLTRVLAAPISRAVLGAVMPMIESAGADYAALIGEGGTFNAAVMFLVGALLSCVLFWILYAIVSLLTRIADRPIAKLFDRMKKPGKAVSALCGAAVGAVCGMVVLTVLLSPLTGLVAIGGDVVSVLDMPELAVVQQVNDSAVVKVNRTLGGKAIFDSLTGADYKGEQAKLSDEMDVAAELLSHAMPMIEKEPATWGEEEIAHLQAAADAFDGSVLFSDVAACALTELAQAWSAGEPFLGIEKPTLGAAIDPTVDTLLRTLANGNKQSFCKNIHSVADIACALIRYDVLAALTATEGGDAMSSVLGAVSNREFTKEFVDILYNDEQLRVLIPETVNLGIRALANSINIPVDKDDMYDRILKESVDALMAGVGRPDVERMIALGDELYRILSRYGVSASPATATSMAMGMVADFATAEEVTVEEMSDWYAAYSEATAKAKAASTASAEPVLMPIGTQTSSPTFDFLGGGQKKREYKGAVSAAEYVVAQTMEAVPYQIAILEYGETGSYLYAVSMKDGSFKLIDEEKNESTISDVGEFFVENDGTLIVLNTVEPWIVVEQPRRISQKELETGGILHEKRSPLPEDYTPYIEPDPEVTVTASNLQNAQESAPVVTDTNSLIAVLNTATNNEIATDTFKDEGAASLSSAEEMKSSMPTQQDMLILDVETAAATMAPEATESITEAICSVAVVLAPPAPPAPPVTPDENEGKDDGKTEDTPDGKPEDGKPEGEKPEDGKTDDTKPDDGKPEDKPAEPEKPAQPENSATSLVDRLLSADGANALTNVINGINAIAGSTSNAVNTIVAAAGNVGADTSALKDALENGTEGAAAVVGNIVSTADTLKSIVDPSLSNAEKTEKIENMMLTLSADGARSIAATVTASMLSDLGLGSQSSSYASMVTVAFNKLADAKAAGISDDQLLDEARALSVVLDVLSATKSSGANDNYLRADGLLGHSAGELLDIFVSSNVISTAAISMVGGSNGTYFTLPAPGKSWVSERDEADILAAIAAVEETIDRYPSTGNLWSPENQTVSRQDIARRLMIFASVFGVEYTSQNANIK